VGVVLCQLYPLGKSSESECAGPQSSTFVQISEHIIQCFWDHSFFDIQAPNRFVFLSSFLHACNADQVHNCDWLDACNADQVHYCYWFGFFMMSSSRGPDNMLAVVFRFQHRKYIL